MIVIIIFYLTARIRVNDKFLYRTNRCERQQSIIIKKKKEV